ncbi:iron ABC transporter permease [Erysipelothrix sp. HDW6B]|uniref:ABC transporter permease n=1 Tax=Erysipelothrix sp. HDW6B TaxID=2714929 RepID=UPI001408EC7A|nr:iron ABC transporter permease [Erysipelothrix sp. HDW6B]QIK85560.1 iron ABC transporter permease [Erysipelothrix sp. HDW6B]
METIKEKIHNLKLGSLAVKLVIAWFLIAFVIYPNANLLVSIFFKNGQFSTDAFGKILTSERAMKALMNSFVLAFTLVITVNVVGTLIVLFTEYFEIKGAKILRLGYMSTLIYGGVVLVSGYKFIYGPTGIVTNLLTGLFPAMNANWFTGYFAVVFVMTFSVTSNHMIFLRNAIRGLDYHTIEAAKNLGASGTSILMKVVMPTLRPTFFAVTILTFLTGLGAMSAPLIVGGPNFQTINPMIMAFAKTPSSQELAALLAVILGVATILLLMIQNKLEKGKNYISISKTKTKLQKQKIENKGLNILAHITAYALFFIYTLPVVLVILFAFSNSLAITTGNLSFSAFTLENFQRLFVDSSAFKPYLISVIYAISAAVIVTAIAVIVSRIVHKGKSKTNAFFEYSMLIPWILPSTLIALGLMLTYDQSRLIVGNKVLIGTLVILLLGYIVVKLPFSFRMIRSAFYSIEDSLEEAAQSMGASKFYTLRRIIIPIILPVLLSVIALNFNSLLAEYDLTVFLYHPLYSPLGVIVKAASDDIASTNAIAMSFVYTVVLMIISSITLYLTQKDDR